MNQIPSTINQTQLDKLPTYNIPDTCHLGTPGMGCHMDPPGYPTYFLRPVYTKHGDSPRRGPDVVLFGRVYSRAEGCVGDDNARRFWAPLPIEHPRVQAWAMSVATYFGGGVIPESGSRAVADLKFYGLGTLRTKLADGTLPLERCRVADFILSFYPDFPRERLIVLCTTWQPDLGNWWETRDTRPAPQDCPGDGAMGRHPVNHTWCQGCGWNATRVLGSARVVFTEPWSGVPAGRTWVDRGDLVISEGGYTLMGQGGSRVFPLPGRRAEVFLGGDPEPVIIEAL